MKSIVTKLMVLCLCLCMAESVMAGKKPTVVSSVVKVEGKAKKAVVKFTDAEGKEHSVKGTALGEEVMTAAQAAAESGEAVEIQFIPGKKVPKLVSLNGVKVAPKAKKKKASEEAAE